MTWHGPTYRRVDGVRIDGAWCLVWRRDERTGGHHPEHLFVYADGLLTLGRFEATDLAGLQEQLASGRIALTLPQEPAELPASAPTWETRYPEPLTDASFLREAADEIARLGGRPTAHDRLWEVVHGYLREPSEPARLRLREAYLAVPAHLRVFVLGDMDLQDRPLRILTTALGQPAGGYGPVVTEQMYRSARAYFADAAAAREQAEERRTLHHADDPAGTPRPPVVLHESAHLTNDPARLGVSVLRGDHEAPFAHAGRTYPTVTHGYWALSAADPADHDRIRACPTAAEAREAGGRAARRANWPGVRLSVMAALLRAKFDQHPRLAEVLLATGDAPLHYTGTLDSPFWREDPRGGRNWTGRLLELVRSELRAAPDRT